MAYLMEFLQTTLYKEDVTNNYLTFHFFLEAQLFQKATLAYKFYEHANAWFEAPGGTFIVLIWFVEYFVSWPMHHLWSSWNEELL